MKAKELLKKLNSCNEAIEWVGDRTIEQAWEDCERGDWMLWFYAKQYPKNIRELTLAKSHCANTVRHLMKDDRSIAAVDAAIAYGNGLISDDELKQYAAAAYAAADAADYAAVSSAYAAYDAAYAAAYAAVYAASATSATAYSASAAEHAAYTDSAAAAAAARKENQKLTADICRKYLTLEDK